MSRMRAVGGLLLMTLCLTTGCRQSDSADKAGGKVANVPNDAGGYGKDLGAPPPAKEVYTPNVKEVIKEGSASDSSAEERRKEAEAARKAAEKGPSDTAAKHDDTPKFEPPKSALEAAQKAKGAPAKADGKPSGVSHNTSGDGAYKANKKPVVALQTTKGVLYLELWPDVAPKHCEQILKLVADGFYDGIVIHRVEPGFVVQAGDPLTKNGGVDAPGVGTGGSGHKLKAEFSNKPHNRGTLSMARSSDPDSADSQFFICLTRQACAPLDGKYTVFGQVLGSGMDIADKIVKGDTIQAAWRVNKK